MVGFGSRRCYQNFYLHRWRNISNQLIPGSPQTGLFAAFVLRLVVQQCWRLPGCTREGFHAGARTVSVREKRSAITSLITQQPTPPEQASLDKKTQKWSNKPKSVLKFTPSLAGVPRRQTLPEISRTCRALYRFPLRRAPRTMHCTAFRLVLNLNSTTQVRPSSFHAPGHRNLQRYPGLGADPQPDHQGPGP